MAACQGGFFLGTPGLILGVVFFGEDTQNLPFGRFRQKGHRPGRRFAEDLRCFKPALRANDHGLSAHVGGLRDGFILAHESHHAMTDNIIHELFQAAG